MTVRPFAQKLKKLQEFELIFSFSLYRPMPGKVRVFFRMTYMGSNENTSLYR